MNARQMTRIAAWIALTLLAAGGIATAAEPQSTSRGRLFLARQGKSDCVITLPAAPSPVEQTAARELGEYLYQVTGARLDVRSERDVPAAAPQIVLGPSTRAQQLVPGLNVAALGPDAIVIKSVGNCLVLCGRPPRGTLYAVYTLLEDVVGCRWWTSQEGYVPKKPTLEVPPQDVVYAPPLWYREAYYRDAFDGLLAARLKLNGNSVRVAPEYGGHYRFAGFVHTFYPLLPPAQYFAAHPEWYSEIQGKRTADRAQLCVTNDEMRKQLSRNVLARLRSDPGVGLVSISQNDWGGRCQCARCRAAEAEEGSPSGPLLRLVNAVAADVEREFPEVLVETLAYQYTRQPPLGVRPRNNVVVRLCSIECSFVQPLEGTQNEKFRRDIEGWNRVAPHLFIWDYVTNFANYILPHPNLRVLAPNIRFFVKNHVIGLFEQGDAGSTVGDFVRLRAWLLAHLMWDPRRDDRALVREFLDGYYGPAAPHLAAYLDRLHDAAERSGVYLRCYMPDTSAWLPLADMNEATRLFDRAAAAVAGDRELSQRVRRERMTLDHSWLTRYDSLRRLARRTHSEFLGPRDPSALCEEFIRLAHTYHAGQYAEGQPFSSYEERLRRNFRPPAPPPERCRGLSEDDWQDVQDHHFRLARPGQWAEIVDDPAASDKKAVRMPGDHREWAVSYPVGEDLFLPAPSVARPAPPTPAAPPPTAGPDAWHCYVMARCEVQASGGPAMTMGIYDARAKRSVAQLAVSVP